ncbi:unnamed protein product [Ambrosiozyma monospora]|uniref:Unnamed protein product n=1 Tax=Ambrosiozyma monospora TaxID=43982 RepID=A0ACB5T3Q8_AMBMO|nr:unnamed protein product [Ambrosiozyma monospora]
MQNVQALSSYVPLIVKGLGYSAVRANAMSSIGSWIAVVVMLFSITFIHKFGFIFIPQLLATIVITVFSAALLGISHTQKKKAKFGLLMVLTGFNTIGHVMNCSWASANSRKPAQRSMRMALMVMAANMAGISGGQILRTKDSPQYKTAFMALTIIACFTLVLVIFMIVQYVYANKRLDKLYPGSADAVKKVADVETEFDEFEKNDADTVKVLVVGDDADDQEKVNRLLSEISGDAGKFNVQSANEKVVSFEQGFRYLY